MTFSIKEYNPTKDKKTLFCLWQSTIGEIWPISQEKFDQRLKTGDFFVAEVNCKIIGFVSTEIQDKPQSQKPRGEIKLILVDKSYQRQGVGRKLLIHALNFLKQNGAYDVQLGGGGDQYFWPGVPSNLEEAVAFFKACGWDYKETSVDMIRNLEDYLTPDFVLGRLDEKVKIDLATEKENSQILLFEKENFPNWFCYFDEKTKLKEFDDILLAKENDEIVGSLTLFTGNYLWEQILGGGIGGFGALGVVTEKREKGIGLALAAKATQILKNREVRISYLGWTWLIDWYGKLGYKVWREYQMSWKIL